MTQTLNRPGLARGDIGCFLWVPVHIEQKMFMSRLYDQLVSAVENHPPVIQATDDMVSMGFLVSFQEILEPEGVHIDWPMRLNRSELQSLC